VGIFESSDEHPPDKIRRYVITGIAFVALVGCAIWYLMRFHTEKQTVHQFLNTIVAGKMEEAYKIWKPAPSYSFKDFNEDWGSQGYYGPIKSYHIEDIEHLKNGSGVVVVVEVSPYQPFPDDHDALKQAKTKEVRLWVEFKDQSLGFPP
jgi:hypothetical protein